MSGIDQDSRFAIGLDIGGTFTDCVVLDDSGGVTLGKAFSTPPDFSGGIIDALTVAAEQKGLALKTLLSGTTLFLHSTTVAENAINNGTLADAGIITTWGHEDTLFAMRGGFGRWSGLTEDEKRNPVETSKPPELVPRRLIKGIHERTDSKAKVLVPLDESGLEDAIAELKDAGATSLGISFLWSFANPENEVSARKVVERLWPEVLLTLSHEIAPILGEYERTSTVALNARLGPVVRAYLENLQRKLEEEGFGGRLLVMQAYGGVTPIEKAKYRPVGMIESGPVSGLVASSHQGRTMGISNILAADMGGTTFKVGVVREGLIEYQREPMVFRYHYALPKMDVVSLGLAGGSVISVDRRTGIPRIGPESAGSYPGPACYDHGGESPTITDVDAILGYLKPEFFVGGRTELNLDKAHAVFEEKVAKPLGMSVVDAASSMYRLANNMIYDLLHKATVQKGLDPRKFALFSFGGTAGMHVASYGARLGVDRTVIPHSASVQGAFGLVISDIVHEEQVSKPMRLPVDPAVVGAVFKELEARVVGQFVEEGFPARDVALSGSVDMSYRQQTHILTVPVLGDGKAITDTTLTELVDLFESMYREKYGPEAGYREAGIELVSFRVRGAVPSSGTMLAEQDLASPDPEEAVVEERSVWVDGAHGMQTVRGYDFELLRSGNAVPGPAVIWSPITTVVVGFDQVAHVDSYRNLVMRASGV